MLYTIGYQGRTLHEFVARLKNFGISALVDVREIPISRKKGFSKTCLCEYLRQYDIDYGHLRELGSPKRLREKLRSDGDYVYFSREYSKHIRSQMQIIEKLYQFISGRVCCVMCYERLPENCHRSIVAEEIKRFDGNGLMVKHI